MSKFKDAIRDGLVWPYSVSEEGDIYTKPNRYNGYVAKRIKGRVTHNGYLRMSLCHEGVVRQTQMHCVVAETFLPNPNNLPAVNHKNGDKTDNRVENLEWCTNAQNTHHAVNTGLLKSNLTSEKVKDIKELLNTMKGKDIAKIFNVSTGTVSQIKTGRTWK